MVKTALLDGVKRRGRALTASALALVSAYCGGGSDPIGPGPTPKEKPIASFTANPREGYAPLAVCFDGSSSRAPGSSISRYMWNFDQNGSVNEGSNPNVCHTYQNPGNYSPGLIVEDMSGQRSPQTLEQVIAKDGKPQVNLSSLNGLEDKTSSEDLSTKVTSPIYPISRLVLTASSPELNVTLNGTNINYTNKTKDFNGNTYIDLVAIDPDNRRTTARVPVNVAPQSDVKGYLEHVLTGARISGVPITSKSGIVSLNANGEFEFQAEPNDTLEVRVSIDSTRFQDVNGVRIYTGQFYNLALPINANGQDVDLGNVNLIPRAKHLATGEKLLSFMKTYMQPSRWADSDMPIKNYIDNNPPSPQYREAVRVGLMDLWQPIVNLWLPQARQISLAQIFPSDPIPVIGLSGLRTDYTYSKPDFGFISFDNTFKKGIIGMVLTQGVNGVAQTTAHEFGHALGFSHSPHTKHIMCGACPALPSAFEGLVVATKYKLKKDAEKFYSE